MGKNKGKLLSFSLGLLYEEKLLLQLFIWFLSGFCLPFARTTWIHKSARHKHSGVVHQDPSSVTFPHDQPDFQKTDRLQYQGPNRWPLRHLKEDHVAISILRSLPGSLLTDNPPIPGKVGHTTGIYVVWAFLRPTIIGQASESAVKSWGPTVFRHPRRLERLTVCRCHYKTSVFFSVI